MSTVQLFNFENFPIRMSVEGEKVWFVAKDVAEALGYSWKGASGTIPHVPEEWKGVHSVQTPSGMQPMAVLTEEGLYFFLNRSDKPAAIPFQKKVSGEILPSIRKTGSFSLSPQPQTRAQRISLALVEAVEEIEELNAQIAAIKPLANYAETVLTSLSSMTTTEIAKELGMTAQELNDILVKERIQFRQSGRYMLYANYANLGFASFRTHALRGDNNVTYTKTNMVWTEKGRKMIHELFNRKLSPSMLED